MNEYMFDSKYGFLTVNFLPLNILSTLFAPIAMCIKDDKTLMKLNSAIAMINYFPIALLSAIVFFICNLIFWPFAYFAAIGKKI